MIPPNRRVLTCVAILGCFRFLRWAIAFCRHIPAVPPATAAARYQPALDLPAHIEEYARHHGHADLIRERIDGAVGE
jgi:Protein of unknown function (DUF664)